jgi:hypothetical protein
VSVRETERDRERDRERERQRQRDRDRERDREGERERDRDEQRKVDRRMDRSHLFMNINPQWIGASDQDIDSKIKLFPVDQIWIREIATQERSEKRESNLTNR